MGRYGVPVICDLAEAMGAKYASRSKQGSVISERTKRESKQRAEKNRRQESERVSEQSAVSSKRMEDGGWMHAGKGARAAVFSFNGNKILTTSGGGMLTSDDRELIEKARFLSRQARDLAPHYEHAEIGYNYRMSNVLAAIGRGQLRVLDARVKRKREIFDYYKQALGDLPGIEFMPEPEWSRSNRWLTVVLITPEFGADREQVRLELDRENIEARPVWKPMHLQPVFQVEGVKTQGSRLEVGQKKKRYKARAVGGELAQDLFNRGLRLPSGTAMSNGDVDRVIDTIIKCRRR